MKKELKYCKKSVAKMMRSVDRVIKAMFKSTMTEDLDKDSKKLLDTTMTLLEDQKTAYIDLAEAIDQQTRMLLEIREKLEKIQK